MLLKLALPVPTTVAQPEALLARLRAGERDALAEIYEGHHAAIRAFAQRVTGDPAAAEDLVHETFVALPRAIRGFRGDASLRSFLLGVALNHARHHIRAAARRRRAMARHAEEVRQADASAAAPDHDLERRRLVARLSRALDRLSLDHRVAFVLCEVEQRTSVEVAEIIGVPEGTVRTRVFHAKRKLRAILEEEPA
ncbi:MAG: RNA polymerase sigma factor [Kofleriaceae bacterium]